jgi:hypothetical protein
MKMHQNFFFFYRKLLKIAHQAPILTTPGARQGAAGEIKKFLHLDIHMGSYQNNLFAFLFYHP